MRHQVKGKKLGRNTLQRRSLFRNLIRSLIVSEQIKTTDAKAKAIKGQVDKLMTMAKKGTVAARRQALAILPYKPIVNKLFDDLAKRNKARTSGYTRIVKIGRRLGDNTLVSRIEFVDKPLPKEAPKAKVAKKVKVSKKTK